jgi:hypothetical protein
VVCLLMTSASAAMASALSYTCALRQQQTNELQQQTVKCWSRFTTAAAAAAIYLQGACKPTQTLCIQEESSLIKHCSEMLPATSSAPAPAPQQQRPQPHRVVVLP